MLGYRIMSAEMLSSLLSANGRIVPTHAESHKYADNTFSHKGNKCFWFFEKLEDAKNLFNVFSHGRQNNYIVEFSFEDSAIVERGKGYYWHCSSADEFVTMSIIPDNITGKMWACVGSTSFSYEDGVYEELEFAEVA